MDDRGVAEAQVHGGRALDAVQRRVHGGEPVGTGGVRAGLQVGLVDLDDVRPGGEEVLDLGVHGLRVVHRGRLEVRVVVVLRLLRHRERPGHGHLHRPVGVAAQELQVADLHRVRPVDRADDAGHRVGVPGAVQRRPRVVDVDALQRGGEVVGVALPADLAVGEQVQPGALLGADRELGRVVLGLSEQRGLDAPQLLRAHPRAGSGRRASRGRSATRAGRSCRPATSGEPATRAAS